MKNHGNNLLMKIKELLIKVKENAKIELTKFKVDEVILKNKTLGGQIQYYRKLNNGCKIELICLKILLNILKIY